MICTSGIAQSFSGAHLVDDYTTRVTLEQPLMLQSSVGASLRGQVMHNQSKELYPESFDSHLFPALNLASNYLF